MAIQHIKFEGLCICKEESIIVIRVGRERWAGAASGVNEMILTKSSPWAIEQGKQSVA
jgi:hypothetical protein